MKQRITFKLLCFEFKVISSKIVSTELGIKPGENQVNFISITTPQKQFQPRWWLKRRYVISSDMLHNHKKKKGKVKVKKKKSNTLLQCSITSKASAKTPLSVSHCIISCSQLQPMQHTTSISQSWPEGLFQCGRAFGSRPRVMMSAHCTEVMDSIIHKDASLWINILTVWSIFRCTS